MKEEIAEMWNPVCLSVYEAFESGQDQKQISQYLSALYGRRV